MPSRWRPYRVESVTPLARGVVEIGLRPERGEMAYEAGQFVYLTPLDETLAAGRGEEHPYTISSAPHDPLLRVGIKDLGDASDAQRAYYLDELKRIAQDNGNAASMDR